MATVRLYRHPHCARCARFARWHRRLDWLNRFEDSTGALAASLTIKRNARSSKINPMHRVGPAADYERGDRKPVKYAHLLEFGTSRISPKPFLTPAFVDTKDQVVKRFGDRIGPEMEKRAEKLRKR